MDNNDRRGSKFVEQYFETQKNLYFNSQIETTLGDEVEGQKQRRCMIPAGSSFKLRWDLFIMLLAIYNCVITPVNVAFQPAVMETIYFLILNLIIDITFLSDIVVNFRTAYLHEKTGDEISDPKKIAKKYIKTRFWIDLAASIPLDFMALLFFSSSNSNELQLISLLKLVRVLRLNRIITYMNTRDDIKLSLKLIKLIFFLILYLHCFG